MRLRGLLARHEIALGATASGATAPVSALLRDVAGLDDEHVSLLGQDARGRCLFLEEPGGTAPAPLEPPRGCAEVNSAAPLPREPGGTAPAGMRLRLPGSRRTACAVQRQHGPSALPMACRLFPRVCLLEPRGVSITLSHYCPTAAALLLRDDVPLAIVRDPPAFAADAPWEGLDAREALPPLLRPDALLDWNSHAAWEAHVIATLGRADRAPEDALDTLACQAERARAWRHVDGPLDVWLRAALLVDAHDPGARRRLHGLSTGPAGDLALFARALGAVPEGARPLLRGVDDVPSLAGVLADVDARFVAPAWAAVAGPVRRYLAAHAFASWSAHQGRGLRTRMLALDVALAVLRVQAARVCRQVAHRLESALFVEAVRASDLLLMHLASREALHASLSACENVRS